MDLKDYILYEDENILVINKPLGILVQQDDSGSPSLDKLVEEYLPKIKTGPIHRLDKDTSGIVLFGKSSNNLKDLSEIFANKEHVEKHYLALVNGAFDAGGEIDAPIRKNFEHKKMVVAPVKSGGKPAKTIFKVLETYDSTTLLDLNLITGRTHQIRVHMSYLRHHVVGDRKYGDYKINNEFEKLYNLKSQFLHSYTLEFRDLKGRLSYLNNKVFKAELPDKFKIILENLKKQQQIEQQ